MDESLKIDESQSSKPAPKVKAYKPKVPFLARPKQHALDKQFSMFLEVFKKLHINIYFVDALAQMPSYSKFLKENLKIMRLLINYLK